MGAVGMADGRERSICTKNAARKMDDVLLGDGRFLIVCTKETERRMGGNESFVRRKRGRGWEGTERLFSAVGENSIDFPRILYRLFPDTSVQPLERHRINDLFVWEERSVPIVQSLRFFSRKGATVRGNRVKVRRCGAAL